MYADTDGLNKELVELLIAKNLKISSAESCTGGLFAALITEVSGASEIFEESIVTYANSAKEAELGVGHDTLARCGAVSRQTAREMAAGICRRTGADIGVGITGIAGPGGGTPEKPVGTVFVGLNVRGDISVYHLKINGSRGEVRAETCRFCFARLLELLSE